MGLSGWLWLAASCSLATQGPPHGHRGFATQGPPPGHERMTSFNCTESDVGPTLDLIWGVLNVRGAVAVAADPDAYENSGQVIAVGFGLGDSVGDGGRDRTQQDEEVSCREAVAGRAQGSDAGPGGGRRAGRRHFPSPVADTLIVGARLQLMATAHQSSGAEVREVEFSWWSSDPGIASVNGAGLVTAHEVGTVTIRASAGVPAGTARIVVVAATH